MSRWLDRIVLILLVAWIGIDWIFFRTFPASLFMVATLGPRFFGEGWVAQKRMTTIIKIIFQVLGAGILDVFLLSRISADLSGWLNFAAFNLVYGLIVWSMHRKVPEQQEESEPS